MKLIAVIQQKGGAYKSTLTMELAQQLASEEYKVAVADLDPHNSNVVKLTRKAKVNNHQIGFTLIKQLKEAKGFDICLLDTQAAWLSNDSNAISYLTKASAVVIPCSPRQQDREGAQETMKRLVLEHFDLDKVALVTIGAQNSSQHKNIQAFGVSEGLEPCMTYIPFSELLPKHHAKGSLLAGRNVHGSRAIVKAFEGIASHVKGLAHV